jgi:hypothetical protein
MKNLINAYQQVIFKECPHTDFSHLKVIFENQMINFKNTITEMNTNVYPIPKEVLSYFVKKIFDNGFIFTNCYSMKLIIELTKKSQNIDLLKFDVKKLEKTKDQSFLFICLPYRLNIWLNDLKNYFDEETIKNIFKEFNGANGVQGTYTDGFLMIINSDVLYELKDIEEIVEHEFIHLFEDIDKIKPSKLSFNLLKILQQPSEFNAFKVNLLNRLDKLSNKYFLQNSINDTNENRKEFLNELFRNASINKNFDDFFNSIKTYDNSKLLESNMYFFWYMIQSKPQEFNQWKSEIYQHFNY